ncbi:hypothetical protein, partial [Streptomyces rhizosphaericus]|uniref:hypothetical protein n=1 Tax=Streptomyces rhizosphaericus TaxID=114699 RepID=UPI0031D37AEA
GHLLPSQSFRSRPLNRIDTELETHSPTATGTTRTAPVHHRITIVRHNHQPAQTSAPEPENDRKTSSKSELPRAKWGSIPV